MAETELRNPANAQCTAYCPICGTDLVFLENECICKKTACGWSCQGCKEEDDV